MNPRFLLVLLVTLIALLIAVPVEAGSAPQVSVLADPPLAPTDLTATWVWQNTIKLTWTHDGDDPYGTDFSIERSDDGLSGWAEVGWGYEEVQHVTVPTCGISYYFRIRAYRESDNAYSEPSNVASAASVCGGNTTPLFFAFGYCGNNTLNVQFSNGVFRGNMHSNWEATFVGSNGGSQAIYGTIFSDPLNLTGSFEFPPDDGGPNGLPIPADWQIEDFRPDGQWAEIAAANGQYFVLNSQADYDAHLSGNYGGLEPGIYYAPFDFNPYQLMLGYNVTFVTEDAWTFQPNDFATFGSPYNALGLPVMPLFFTNYAPSDPCLSSDEALQVIINNTEYEGLSGIIYAPHGAVQMSVADADLLHMSVFATMIEVSGSEFTWNAALLNPPELTATPISPTQIDLLWTDIADNESVYDIERSPNGVDSWLQIGETSANDTTFSNTGLSCLTYFYRVRAYRADGGEYSNYSNIASADPCAPPAAPSISVWPLNKTEIRVDWVDNSTDETGFLLERSTDGIVWTTLEGYPAIFDTGTLTSHLDAGLTCQTLYYYRVSALKKGDDSSQTTAQATTHPCNPPDAPTDLEVSATTHTKVDLSWIDHADDETSFSIERSPNGVDGWTLIGTTSADDTTYSDTTVACGETYFYRVHAYRAVDSEHSAYSNTVEASTWTCGTFADVPTPTKEWMQNWIEAFYAAEITTGCGLAPSGQPLYCPEREVTRAEMAVFIIRALHYGNLPYTPTDPDDHFADVPVAGMEWMQPFIEEFYGLGITTGCAINPLQFCPEREVTRAEMAVFILRALEGGSYQPPAASGYFDDVPVATKEWMEPWIDEFYRRGITGGCAVEPLQFCPERPVTRAEMAVFILRAFESIPNP